METIQLISPGILVLLIGILFRLFPPKKINSCYGYRTKRSKLNQTTWDVANRFSSWSVIVAGMLGINTGLSCKYLLLSPFDLIITISVQIILLVCIIMITEYRLKGLFDDSGNWRGSNAQT